MTSTPRQATSVTIVIQTRILDGQDAAFAAWNEAVSQAAAAHAGFIDQKVMRPSPPAQVDWVIRQRFASMADAQHWMHSDTRAGLLERAQAMLEGHDDVHIVADGGGGVLPSPVSAVISTRVRPGREADYHAWERHMATVQANAAGFQGYRIEPPVPGVQDSWLAIVRFDSDANLDLWMRSPERLQLLEEGQDLSETVHTRIVHAGFDQWFPGSHTGAASGPAPWKMNLLVLSQLYPVVFLLDYLVMSRSPVRALNMPFWLALFIGNVASVTALNYLVPWVSSRFGWFLEPASTDPAALARIRRCGIAAILALYAVSLLVFSQLP